VFWFVLFTLPLNFALGAAAGVVAHRRLAAPPRPAAPQPATAENGVLESAAAEGDPAVTSPSEAELDLDSLALPAVDQIPAEWLTILEAEAIESKSYVEAATQVLRLEVWRYRERLVSIENRLRNGGRDPDPEAVQQLVRELRELNSDWVAMQAQAAMHLGERRGMLGNFEDVGAALENALLDQQAQIETTCSNISLLDFESDLRSAANRLIVETLRLLDLAHVLRDCMQESLVTIMRADRRLDGLERRIQIDGLTGLLNRTGVEIALDQWWREDIARQRLVSMALIDVDDCGKLNQRIGTRNCDRVIAAFGKLLDDLVPKDRGHNRVARFEGQTYALFCGDAGPRNVMSLVERIRQTVAATTFGVGDEVLEITAACAVTEIQKDDTPEKLYKRLRQALRTAKKNRNCTVLDEGGGAKLVEPPQFQVKGRLVRVEEVIRGEA
jgi:diguanylate cyclase (GGDEF)-like protein